MSTNEEHVSMFELDLYFATGAPDARIEEHVAGCERCGGYLAELARLQEGAALPELLALPRGRGLPARRAERGLGAGRSLGLVMSLAAGLVVLGAVSALLLVSPSEDAPAVAVKGGPGIQLLVRRGESTRAWNGTSPVRAGDVLALRVACEEFERVAVLVPSGQARERWSPLFQGDCPPAGEALPFTLVVDEQPGREEVAVVFSRSLLAARDLDEALARRRVDGEVWVIRFELDKEASR